MTGRMLYLPPRSKQSREILMVYGHHSSLERWWGLAQNLNDFGAVTMPDLPGFGGMDSFYKIGKSATLDNYADYLAAFVKMRYRRKKVDLVGISFGFLVVTRMLQRYPELTSKVNVLLSAMGFMRADNFVIPKPRYNAFLFGTKLLSVPPFPALFRAIALHPAVLHRVYTKTSNAKLKLSHAGGDKKALDDMMQMEVELWHNNDVKSWAKTGHELLTVDNCATQIALPVWHIYTPHDNFFDNAVIEQQMRVVFSEYQGFPLDAKMHSPSVIATKQQAAAFVPESLRQYLKQRSSAK